MGLVQLLIVAAMVISHGRRPAADSRVLPKPVHRTLLVLIVIGLLCIALMPEAWFVLPAFDAIGLDVVVALTALELGRYWSGAMRLVAARHVHALGRRLLQVYVNLPSLRSTTPYYAIAALWLIVGAKVALHTLLPP